MTITAALRKKYKRRSWITLGILVIFIIVWISYPFQEFFSPVVISGGDSFPSIKKSTHVVSVSDITLYYTGYCDQKNNTADNYFYYGFIGNKCVFFLLDDSTCNQGQESISFKDLRGTIYENEALFDQLTTFLAEDLTWDKAELSKMTQPYFINETGYNYGFHLFLLIIFTIATAIVVLFLAAYILYTARPEYSLLLRCGFSPKRAKNYLAVAEADFKNHCLVTAGTFAITKRFLMDFSKEPFFVPIKKIAWVYEHSTVTGLPGKYRKLSHTLTIYISKNRAIHSTHPHGEDVDTVLSYFRDYYPEILNGFNEENRTLFQSGEYTSHIF